MNKKLFNDTESNLIKEKQRYTQWMKPIQIPLREASNICTKSDRYECNKCRNRDSDRYSQCYSFDLAMEDLMSKDIKRRDLMYLINRNNIFHRLANFITEFLQIPPEMEIYNSLISNYLKFMRVPNPPLDESLVNLYGPYTTDWIQGFLVVGTASNRIARENVQDVYYRIRRLKWIMFNKVFDNPKYVALLSGALKIEKIDIKNCRELMNNILGLLYGEDKEEDRNLLLMIILYCYDLYLEIIWLTDLILTDASKSKLLEYRYIQCSASLRYAKEMNDVTIAQSAISTLEGLISQYSTDPRVYHLLGKTYGRVYDFGLDENEEMLHKALFYTKKALEVIEQNQLEEYFELTPVLTNNLLYIVTRIEYPESDDLSNADKWFYTLQQINEEKPGPHRESTIAHYYYLKHRFCVKEERICYLEKGIATMERAIELAEKEKLNRQEIMVLEDRLTKWREDFAVLHKSSLLLIKERNGQK